MGKAKKNKAPREIGPVGGGTSIAFPVDLVRRGYLSVPQALILQQLHFWLTVSGHEREGRRWIYKTARQWTEQDFNWWTEGYVRKLLRSLEDACVDPETGESLPPLVYATDKFNKMQIDRTKWYSINYDHPWLKAVATDRAGDSEQNSSSIEQNSSSIEQNSSSVDGPQWATDDRPGQPEQNSSSIEQNSSTALSRTPVLTNNQRSPETTPETTVPYSGAKAPTYGLSPAESGLPPAAISSANDTDHTRHDDTPSGDPVPREERQQLVNDLFEVLGGHGYDYRFTADQASNVHSGRPVDDVLEPEQQDIWHEHIEGLVDGVRASLDNWGDDYILLTPDQERGIRSGRDPEKVLDQNQRSAWRISQALDSGEDLDDVPF